MEAIKMNSSESLSIGAGPSDLSLPALAKNRPDISVSVLESKRRIDWHPGIQSSNARMQSSALALKDLVIPVDPRTRFGFLSFFKPKRRLYSGLVGGLGDVSRIEFEDIGPARA